MTDILGREVKEGDHIAYGARAGNYGALRVGRVDRIFTKTEWAREHEFARIRWDDRTSDVKDSTIQASALVLLLHPDYDEGASEPQGAS
jgi:hypothetical protein